nr:TadE/TadG family type IV pilus assembly protein [Streptomyces sp. SID5468]
MPVLLLVALAGVQLGLAAYTAAQAGTAARAAARTGDPGAARAAVSGWLSPQVRADYGDGWVRMTVTVPVPSVLPGIRFVDPVTRSATMPRD